MTLNELPELRDLPVSEKLELVDDIWKHVAKELDEMEVTEEEKRLLDDRWSSFLENPQSALTTGDFMDRLKALRA